MFALPPLLLPLLLALSTTQPQDTPQDWAESAAQSLKRIGYVLDLDEIRIEVADEATANRDLQSPSHRAESAAQLETRMALQGGFGVWMSRSRRERVERRRGEGGADVLAYYQAEDARVVVLDRFIDEEPWSLQPQALMAHELVHAWQHLVLDSDLRPTLNGASIEQGNIRHFLIEGEASFVMEALSMEERGEDLGAMILDPLEQEDDLLYVIEGEIASMAYTHGARFVASRWLEGGWEAARGIWQDPPTSMEQILHPSKDPVDEPQEVRLPAWPADLPAADVLASECLGEFEIYRLIRAHQATPREARLAACGWDGDLFQRYKTASGETALVWRTLWDRDIDAQQFYDELARRGDGEWRLHGRVVDWVRTQDGALAETLLRSLAEALPELAPGPEDASGTARLEAAWIADGQLAPFVTGERWVAPRCDLSAPIPADWSPVSSVFGWEFEPSAGGAESLRPSAFVQPVPAGTSVQRILELERAEYAALNILLLESELRTIGGRSAAWFRQGTGSDGEGQDWRAVFVLDGERIDVSLSASAAGPRVKPSSAAEFFDGLTFGADSIARPAEDSRGEWSFSGKAVVPESEQRFELVVFDGQSGERCADQEVLIAPISSVDAVHGAPSEEQVRERGRRFRTDDNGRVSISFRADAHYACTRLGQRFAFDLVFPRAGREEILEVLSGSDLVVRVVDEDGNSVWDVPVGILEWNARSSRFVEEHSIRGVGGLARWDNVFHQLQMNDGSEYYVVLAFPHADGPHVRIRPGDDLSEPIVLVMPPTGSMLVRIDPDSIPNDPLVAYYPHAPQNPMYRPFMEVLGEHWGPTLEYDLGSTALDPNRWRREPYTWLVPHVGLGLELNIAPSSRRQGLIVSGPVDARERVEVTLQADEFPAKSSYAGGRNFASVREGVVVRGRCVDAVGEPVEDETFRWRVRAGRADGEMNFSFGDVSTDEQGRFQMRVGPGLDSIYVWNLQLTLEDESPKRWWGKSMGSVVSPQEVDLGNLWPEVDGQELTPIPFHLLSQKPGHEVRVFDAKGEPIPGALCILEKRDQPDPVSCGFVDATSRGVSTTLRSHGTTDTFGKAWLRGVFLEATGTAKGEREPGAAPQSVFTLTIRAAGYIELAGATIDPLLPVSVFTLESNANAASVHGSVLLPAGAMDSGVQGQERPAFWIEMCDAPGRSVGRLSYHFEGDVMTFQSSDLWPGSYLLHLRIGLWESTSGLDPTRMRFAPPEAHNPEPLQFTLVAGKRLVLDPVDLRERLRVIHVRVVDESGKHPNEGARVDVASHGGLQLDSFKLADPSQSLRVATFERDVDLKVQAPGCVPQTFEGVQKSLEVVLKRDLYVRVKLARDVALPDDSYAFQIRLSPVDRSPGAPPLRRMRFATLKSEGAVFLLNAGEHWSVRWQLTRTLAGRIWAQDVIAANAETLVVDASAAEPLLLVEPPSDAEIAAAIEALGE